MGKEKRTEKSAKIKTSRYRERLIPLLESLGISALIAWLGYESFYGLLWFPIVARFNEKRYAAQKVNRREEVFSREFKELLLSLSSGLSAGYSVENAFAEAEKNLQQLFGEKSELLAEIHAINRKVQMHIPVETAFLEFSQKHAFEELQEFAGVFSFAKRLGGDYGKNIRRCALKLEEKLEVRQEISTMIAEKQLELKVMSIMPAAVLLYVRLTSYDFMSGLYGNLAGILTVSGSIVVYIFVMKLGRRLIAIPI